MTHKKLFIPGPVDVRPDVLEKMSTPMIGHRTKDASALQQRISVKLQKLMLTKNEIILSTSSGSGLMDGAVRCFTSKKAAVFSIGAFGDRWYKMCTSNGIAADIFRSELGQPTTADMVREVLSSGEYDLVTITHNETATGVHNPIVQIANVLKEFPNVIFCVDAVSSLGGESIPVDELGIDVCITSSQKCLGLPPGLAIASVTERAIEKAKSIPNRGLYFDYVELYKFVKEKPYQYPRHLLWHICLPWITSLTAFLRRGLRLASRDIRLWLNESVPGPPISWHCTQILSIYRLQSPV